MSKGGRGASIRVTGLKPTLAALALFPEKLQRKVMRPAVSKAATPVVKKARKLAPLGAGLTPSGAERPHLRKTITKTRAKISKRTGSIVVVVGPEKNKAPHSHLVHDGTAHHDITLKKPLVLGRVTLPAGFVIRHPGARAQPFLTDAAAACRSQSLSIMRRELVAGMKKQLFKPARTPKR